MSSHLENAGSLAFVGPSSLAFPVTLFGAAAAGVPFVPLNYRLSGGPLADLVGQLDAPLLVLMEIGADLGARGHRVIGSGEFLDLARHGVHEGDVSDQAESPAVLLYTSGTTSARRRRSCDTAI